MFIEEDNQDALELGEEEATLEPKGDDQTEDLSDERLIKAKEIAKNQEIRAKKAEREIAKLKAQLSEKLDESKLKAETSNESPVNFLDLRALSKVHDDDVERVQKFAKAEGLTIAESLKNPDLQAILKNREKLRDTAEATNTGGSKLKIAMATDEEIVEKAKQGNLPTTDEGITRLVQAQINQQKAIAKKARQGA